MLTPLQRASTNGDVEMVQELLKSGADISPHGKTSPLIFASLKGHVEVVKLLLENGADMSETPLHVAFNTVFGNNKFEMFKFLLEKGSDFEKSRYPYGKNPLYLAIDCGNLEMVKLLLEKGINIDYECGDQTPIFYALKHDKFEIFKLLLENGANIEARCDIFWTCLSRASSNNNVEIVQLLLKNGAAIESTFCGITPLQIATKRCHLEVVKILEEHIAQKKIKSFFEMITSKNITNKLRIEPNNLFDPEFLGLRKRILKIDDSRFNLCIPKQ